jgi:hypothetical protein
MRALRLRLGCGVGWEAKSVDGAGVIIKVLLRLRRNIIGNYLGENDVSE